MLAVASRRGGAPGRGRRARRDLAGGGAGNARRDASTTAAAGSTAARRCTTPWPWAGGRWRCPSAGTSRGCRGPTGSSPGSADAPTGRRRGPTNRTRPARWRRARGATARPAPASRPGRSTPGLRRHRPARLRCRASGRRTSPRTGGATTRPAVEDQERDGRAGHGVQRMGARGHDDVAVPEVRLEAATGRHRQHLQAAAQAEGREPLLTGRVREGQLVVVTSGSAPRSTPPARTRPSTPARSSAPAPGAAHGRRPAARTPSITARGLATTCWSPKCLVTTRASAAMPTIGLTASPAR